MFLRPAVHHLYDGHMPTHTTTHSAIGEPTAAAKRAVGAFELPIPGHIAGARSRHHNPDPNGLDARGNSAVSNSSR
mgnify:CR=1 FL=1